MNPTILIDAIVRQTTLLIAALATATGRRAPLARVADQVFGELVRELREQGVGNKVIADMFGMALRTYQARVARLSASRTDVGRSLWEAVLSHVQAVQPVLRAAILERFARDDETIVRGVLRDLVDSGLLLRSGRGDGTTYSVAGSDEAGLRDDPRTLDSLVLVALHRGGPASRNSLMQRVSVSAAALDAALARLVEQGAVTAQSQGGVLRYGCESCVVPFGDAAGWEAAVFDHYQAMVTALVTKLRIGRRRADLDDSIGGSTFTFDIWRGHPMEREVLGTLRALREHGIALRERLEAYNAQHRRPDREPPLRVIAYMGQTVKEEESNED